MGNPFMKAIMDLPGDVDRDLDGFDLAGFVQANNPDTAELWEIAVRFGK